MTSEFSVENKQVTVTLNGSIYVEEAASLREQLIDYIDKGHSIFCINVASVEYIDSSGLGVLVAIHKRALQNNGKVIIKGLSGIVKELFELTRLNKVFELQ
ncbi:STAS domain-containing protein|uniref:Anti-sigma factor antagonist n=1 Tax=Dendrosporobacter quercicolus TaxID=146817 RepID=A0A1G9TKF8_9FIRM|nr:STAS domain-containing protein [Dendrosporobacter quercicolus]NSL48934.1 STAS domain-containing protein [Dendrosporobacter quercicolus DSM 1736]SDM48102.1 anti-sigma B factor antagonist [Dendrosporobacter quercicolus]